MNLHVGRELTDQVIAKLTTGGLTVGDAVAPATVPAGSGYVVVYPLAGGTFDGTVIDSDDDTRAVYQLTAVGSSRKQAEWVADEARVIMKTATWTLTNRGVILVHPEFLGGVQRDDDVQPPKFYCPDRWSIWTGPS